MMTMIARTVDGLPLVGTMQESEEVRIDGPVKSFVEFMKLSFICSRERVS